MKVNLLKILVGFILLFCLYHGADDAILFKNSTVGFLGFQFLFFLAAWLIARWQFGSGLSAWGLDTRKNFMAHLLSGMVMGILLYGITFLISLSTGAEEVIGKPNYRASILPFLLFIFGNFLSSFSEDILTRGYIFKHLKDRANPLVILFISAAVYLLNHIHRLNSSGETRLFLFVLGVLFVVPLIVTKRLWFTGGMHWAGNCVFYFTHSVIKTQDGENPFTANFILVLCSLVFLLLNYGVLKWLQTKWAIDE